MKKDIHPKYHDEAKITCSCGNVIVTGSTLKEKDVEICSACHPFYTGKKKLVDSTGRVDRFKQRMKKFSAMEKAKKEKESAKKTAIKKTKKTTKSTKEKEQK